jgi:hypothetical protein
MWKEISTTRRLSEMKVRNWKLMPEAFVRKDQGGGRGSDGQRGRKEKGKEGKRWSCSGWRVREVGGLSVCGEGGS